jgi:hypothetical protein
LDGHVPLPHVFPHPSVPHIFPVQVHASQTPVVELQTKPVLHGLAVPVQQSCPEPPQGGGGGTSGPTSAGVTSTGGLASDGEVSADESCVAESGGGVV